MYLLLRFRDRRDDNKEAKKKYLTSSHGKGKPSALSDKNPILDFNSHQSVSSACVNMPSEIISNLIQFILKR